MCSTRRGPATGHASSASGDTGSLWHDAAVRVVIAEDNALLRDGLHQLLELEGVDVVASCSDADELLTAVDDLLPDAVLTDIRMPPAHDDEGIRAALEIRRRHPSIGVLVLSQYASPSYALELLAHESAGVGYLVKDRVDVAQVMTALQTVAVGGSFVDSEVVSAMVAAHAVGTASALAELTDRELEVLQAMAEGQSNSAIAARVHAAERTVEKYISSIFSKLLLVDEPDVNRRVRAVLVYLSAMSSDPTGT